MSLFFKPKTLARLCTEEGQTESLSILLDHGCSRRALIHSAIACDQFNALKTLLDAGADPNEVCDGLSPLLLCLKVREGSAEKMNDEIEQLLIKKGADPFMAIDGKTVLYHAAESGNLKFVQFLSKVCHHVGVLPPALSPLAAAIEQRHFAVSSYLLRAGANPNAEVQVAGQTLSLLDLATMRRDGRTLTLLVNYGADLSKRRSISEDGQSKDDEMERWLNKFAESQPVKESLERRNQKKSLKALRKSVGGLEDAVKQFREKLKVGSTLEISEKVSELRECLRIAIDATSQAKDISNEVNARRKNALDILSRHFVRRDLIAIEPEFQRDVEELTQALGEFMHRVEEEQGTGKKLGDTTFSKALVDSLDFSKARLPCCQDYVCETMRKNSAEVTGKERTEATRKERTDLVSLNKSLQTLIGHVVRLRDCFVELRECGEGFIESSLKSLIDFRQTMDGIQKNHQRLLQMGFKADIYDELVQHNRSKESVIDATIKELETEQQNVKLICDNLYKELHGMAR